jgi:hypothetical protein
LAIVLSVLLFTDSDYPFGIFTLFLLYLDKSSFLYYYIRCNVSGDVERTTNYGQGTDKVYQFLAHGRWFSPGTPFSSTTKTGRHDIAEILLKVALKKKKKKKSLMFSRNR